MLLHTNIIQAVSNSAYSSL